MPVTPPRPRFPPLNALRAFEAAARLNGFAAAAKELCVTPGAVAQQVKILETWAGAALFERHAQGVRLTPLGESVKEHFITAFDQLGEAVQILSKRARPKSVRIATLPSIAQLWLSPRFAAIRSAAPELIVSVTAMESPPNLRREPFDLSIFFENKPIKAGVIELAQDVIFPVCSPEIAARIKHPQDLAQENFLHDLSWQDDWSLWIAAALPDQALDTRGSVFSLYSLAVEEAKNGAGVLIGHEALVAAHLAAGTLVAPFQIRVKLKCSLAVTVSKSMENDSVFDKLIEVLRMQADDVR